MTHIQLKLINQARKLYSLPKEKGMHLTFIVKRNTIISMGRNQIFKTHPMAKKFGHYKQNIHSELDALLNFSLPLSELYRYTLYNIRIDRNGFINSSKPCKYCMKMLTFFGVNKLYWTKNNGKWESASCTLE